MTTIAVHQPAYLPWIGYFEKIIQSDIFIYLDTVQFEKNNFTNRNKIKTAQGEIWLTVPEEDKFENAKIKVVHQDYKHPIYPELTNDDS